MATAGRQGQPSEETGKGHSTVYLLQAGPYVVELFNTQAGGLSLLFLAFFEAIAVGWIYGGDRLIDNIETMIGYRPCKWWVICWKFIAPLIILSKFIYHLL